MKNIVTSKWLKDNIYDNKLVIFDVRHVLGDENYGKERFKIGHIPNAIFVPVEELLTGKINEHGGRHPLPDMNKFAIDMNNLGINNKSKIIIYDDGDLTMAGRLWLMLKFIGLKEVYVLLGGFNAWKMGGNPLSTELPSIRKVGELTFNLQKDMIADINDVRESIDNNEHVIIDSRAAERYRGEVEPIDKVPGHIPGALNFPWTDLSGDGKIMDENQIKDYYKTIDNYKKIIVHCGSGITGTVNLIFMEEVGLSPVFYVGGYSDWISYPDNEVVTEV